MKKFILTAFCFLFLYLSNRAQPSTKIPSFTFYTINNSKFSNKQLEAGKKLFFIFFDSDCEHCQKAVEFLNLNNTQFKSAALYFITLDSPLKTKNFFLNYGMDLLNKKNVTILYDKNQEFINKFKPRKYPSLFLYSTNKKLLLYSDDEKELMKFIRLIQ